MKHLSFRQAASARPRWAEPRGGGTRAESLRRNWQWGTAQSVRAAAPLQPGSEGGGGKYHKSEDRSITPLEFGKWLWEVFQADSHAAAIRAPQAKLGPNPNLSGHQTRLIKEAQTCIACARFNNVATWCQIIGGSVGDLGLQGIGEGERQINQPKLNIFLLEFILVNCSFLIKVSFSKLNR